MGEYQLLTSYSSFELWGCMLCGAVTWNKKLHTETFHYKWKPHNYVSERND